MSNEPLFDRRALLDNLGEDVELMQVMAQTFVDDTPRLISELRDALARGDAPDAVRASHSVKGSAANFGAAPLIGVVGAMEQACRAGNLATASGSLTEAERLITALVVELRQELHAP
ncbi:Hpt domain-containing protein [Aromatoleum diolicum]|uniref:HPt domain-containing protein n=1 Tax=Aromatoleum diolicum TaxID=75796 RepID=A0ABX1QBU2_9RHOO|nr:Hpt domain-containing protein [Aromatoleum diolicum]NMG74937.1 hypothetical protein [Aromatoleum diolicum]